MTQWENRVFGTNDQHGKPNGLICRVWEEDTELEGYRPKQVYMSLLLPGAEKGPHLHLKRDGLFCCIDGYVDIILRDGLGYRCVSSGGPFGPVAVHVPAGTPALIRNRLSDSISRVLNLSSGKYDPSDEHEVLDFDPLHRSAL